MIGKSLAKSAAPLLRHDGNFTSGLGCIECPEKRLCGGLHVEAGLFSCLDHCNCTDKIACDVVCPRNPAYTARIREVGGLDLGALKKRRPLRAPKLPDVIPLFYRSPKIQRPIDCEFAAIPFNETYRRVGRVGVPLSRSELNQKFKFSANTKLVLSGVENDRHVEQWWGSGGRKELLAGIRDLGIVFATTPNFSAMLDVPRHDNLHALKRIALSWAELHDAGIPTALHVNAINEHDFRSIRDFLTFHTEIALISFEFTTGSANRDAGQFFCGELVRLTQSLRRRLTLVLRGGVQWLPSLAPAFEQIVMIDTSSAMGAVNRRRAVLAPGGHIKWYRCPTEQGDPLDELLAHNLKVVSTWLSVRKSTAAPLRPQHSVTAGSNVERHADNEAAQRSLL